MSLTPGYLYADETGHIGLSLTEIACIVGEWDRAVNLPHDMRQKGPDLVVKGELHALRVRWYTYGDDLLSVRRGGGGESVYVGGADIAEMRRVLAGQVAP